VAAYLDGDDAVVDNITKAAVREDAVTVMATSILAAWRHRLSPPWPRQPVVHRFEALHSI
jgi:hypothetical protein